MESTYLKELFSTPAMLFRIWGMEKRSDQELHSQHPCLCHSAENWAGTIFWGQISSQSKEQAQRKNIGIKYPKTVML